MYNFNRYIQNLMSAMLCFEQLKIKEADAALKARSKSKKDTHTRWAVAMAERQDACMLELMSYFDHRIKFEFESSPELIGKSHTRFEKGPCNVGWSKASNVRKLKRIIILDSPDYCETSQVIIEFFIDSNRDAIDGTDVRYYHGLTDISVFAKYFKDFDFLKYAELPEGINTPELVSAYLAGINHHASLAIGDPEDPLSEALCAAC